jgi:DNA (cytosine-5)-methyltransferase 1
MRDDSKPMPDAGDDLLCAIEGRRFGAILADPPWQFQNNTGKVAPEHWRLKRYSTLSLDEIKALPVAEAAADTSHLYLWVPNALLPDGLAVMEAWGFSYKSNLVWHKIRKDGGPDGRGVGFYFRNVTEILLFGVRGRNARTLAPGRRQVNYLATRKREHSRKPDEQYGLIEACSPGPFLELFARGIRSGWECWGAEATGDYEPRWATYKVAAPKAEAGEAKTPSPQPSPQGEREQVAARFQGEKEPQSDPLHRSKAQASSLSPQGECEAPASSISRRGEGRGPADSLSPRREGRAAANSLSPRGEGWGEGGLSPTHPVCAEKKLTVLELCAGAGGQALGLEQAGFDHTALIEIDADACRTLRHNRPDWNVIHGDVTAFDAKPYRGVDLVAGGLPCPPFSVAGKQRGEADERNLFPSAFRIIQEAQPKAVMIENVRGLLDARFAYYRELIVERLKSLGYVTRFELLNASNFGVPQNRPRVFIIGLRPEYASAFTVPEKQLLKTSVGDTLYSLMKSEGWRGAKEWRKAAAGIAPAVVGGSKKHGGPDLGPTRARAAWAKLHVDGRGIALNPPARDFIGFPRLTVAMAGKIQGFPDGWLFTGGKTAAYRQAGNALPPPLAFAVAQAIHFALEREATQKNLAAGNGR